MRERHPLRNLRRARPPPRRPRRAVRRVRLAGAVVPRRHLRKRPLAAGPALARGALPLPRRPLVRAHLAGRLPLPLRRPSPPRPSPPRGGERPLPRRRRPRRDRFARGHSGTRVERRAQLRPPPVTASPPLLGEPSLHPARPVLRLPRRRRLHSLLVRPRGLLRRLLFGAAARHCRPAVARMPDLQNALRRRRLGGPRRAGAELADASAGLPHGDALLRRRLREHSGR
mmetsp:Transcript_25605/g.84302  ORF Transcript_25605/g.84302 Transcript_25605/m.84302 type:complete len:228 (-) Transcript_25605:1441-2124(-)